MVWCFPQGEGASQVLLRYAQVHRSKLMTRPLVRGQLTLRIPHSAPSFLLWSPQNWAAIRSFGIIFIKDTSFIYFGEKHAFPTRMPSYSYLSIRALPILQATVMRSVCDLIWTRLQPLLELSCSLHSCSCYRLYCPHPALRAFVLWALHCAANVVQ